MAGLEATVGYLEWVGEISGYSGDQRVLLNGAFEAFTDYERRLTTRLIDGIAGMPGVTVHGITNPNQIAERVPTVSFTHRDLLPGRIAKSLADEDICVWSGHNYAYEVVRQLGLDEEQGVVRIGLAHYNTEAEVDGTLAALARVLQ